MLSEYYRYFPYISIFHLSNCSIVHSSYTNILLSICPIIHPIQLSILHIPISYYPFVQSSILFNCPFFIYQYPIIHLSNHPSYSIVHSSYTNILLSICPFSIYRYHSPITFLYVLSCSIITCKYVCIILLYIHNCNRVCYQQQQKLHN